MQNDFKLKVVVAVFEIAKSNLKSHKIFGRINQFRNMMNL